MFDAFFLFHKIHVDLTVTKSILVALFLYSFTIKYGPCLYKYSCGSKGRVQGSDCTNMCSACNSRHCNWINTCVKCSLVPCINGIRLYQNWQLDRILIYKKPYHWKAIKHTIMQHNEYVSICCLVILLCLFKSSFVKLNVKTNTSS